MLFLYLLVKSLIKENKKGFTMKYKKIILVCSTLLLSNMSSAMSNFPYSQFKEVQFSNPIMTTEFENLMSSLQKSDITYEKDYNKINSDFTKKFFDAQKRIGYKTPEDQNTILSKIIYKEKKTFNDFNTKALANELIIFNKYVKRIQSNKKINKEEQSTFIKSIKDVHKAYSQISIEHKYNMQTINTFCFQENKNAPELCYDLYESSKNRMSDFRKYLVPKYNSFVTKYKISSKDSPNNHNSFLQIRVDEAVRKAAFKWEE